MGIKHQHPEEENDDLSILDAITGLSPKQKQKILDKIEDITDISDPVVVHTSSPLNKKQSKEVSNKDFNKA